MGTRNGTIWPRDSLAIMDSKPVDRRELGLLSELAMRQDEYRGHIIQLRESPDRSFSEAVISSEGMDTEVLISVATVLFELSTDPNRETSPADILWAQEFVDHMDTLGMEVRPKFHAPDGHNEGRGHVGS
jgi:hypothetical protein